MIGKALSFAVVAFILAPVITAQTPQPPPRVEPNFFSFSYDGDGGYLGVQSEEVTRENFARYGLRDVRGVAVAKVVEGSPAATAGIQDGDVIVKINGEDVTSARKLTRLVSEISPDHTARLTMLRGGSERELNVTVGKRPMPKLAEGSFAFPEGLKDFEFKMPDMEKLDRYRIEPPKPGEPMVFSFTSGRQIGVGLTPLTKQLSDHFGVTAGALVNTVREDSPAAKAGLRAGDIITEIDGKTIHGDLDAARAIGGKKEGDVSVTFFRGGQKQTVRITPEEGKGGLFEHFEWKIDPAAPGEPGVFKFERPEVRVSPMPLNRPVVPKRIV